MAQDLRDVYADLRRMARQGGYNVSLGFIGVPVMTGLFLAMMFA